MELPVVIQQHVRAFAMRRRWLGLLRAGGLALCFAAAYVLLVCMLDRMLAMPSPVRMATLWSGAAVVVMLLIRPLWRALRPIDRLEAAAELERCNPVFSERLRTVISQAAEPQRHRGSEQMLSHLVEETSRIAVDHPPHCDARWARLALPWVAGLSLLALVGVMNLWPAVGMPMLLERLVRPSRPLPPVTTTRIVVVEPQTASLRVGQPLTVRAHVERLAGGGVDILTSHDGKTWSRMPMQPLSASEYAFTLPAVQRDVRFYLQAGDAMTQTRQVKVHRPPVLASYRVRYEYPAYTVRPALTVTNNDGIIEALVGTKVSIAAVASEPLASARLICGPETVSMGATAESNVREAQIIITAGQIFDVEMISDGGLRTRLNSAVTVRAEPDREPLVRLVQPAEDLRLHRRDQVMLHYQALDDYGVTGLWAAVRVNSSVARRMPISRQGDTRRQEGQFSLDLAPLDVKVGDVISVSLGAQDGAGRRAASLPRFILVSPQSIDASTHERIAELNRAMVLARASQQELERAAESLRRSRAGHATPHDYVTYRLNVSRSLANAVEDALLMNQSLLRVCSHSPSPEATVALANCVDRARTLAATGERLVLMDTSDAEENLLAEGLKEAIESARALGETIRVLCEGQQAGAILVDRSNLKIAAAQSTDRAMREQLNEVIARAQKELAVALRQLSLQGGSSDLDGQLQRRVEAAMQCVRASRPVDFEPVAARWAESMRRNEPRPPALAERLAAAAAVEALRPDGYPPYGRDLQLASRAVTRLMRQAMMATETDPGAGWEQAAGDLPAAIGAIQREQHFLRRSEVPVSDDHAAFLRAEANAARDHLRQWAGQPDYLLAGVGDLADIDAEDLAMQASAEMTRRNYGAAARIDEKLSNRMPGIDIYARDAMESVSQAMDAAQDVDRVSAVQDRVIRETGDVVMQDPLAIAVEQGEVAEQIGRIGPGNETAMASAQGDSRAMATATIHEVQEVLSRMPGQIAALLETADAYRQATLRADQADRTVANAPPALRAAAVRARDQAQNARLEARSQLNALMDAMSPTHADAMAAQLRRFEPETLAAAQAMSDLLEPAMKSMAQAMRTADRAEVDKAAEQLRSAIEHAQQTLREAQAQIIQRDPLVAARWYADAAAQVLADRPADMSRVQTHQDAIRLALTRAWQNQVQKAARNRLATTPGFRSILSNRAPQSGIDPRMAAAEDSELSLRRWTALKERTVPSIAAPMRDSDASAYTESLRLYFEAINKAAEKPAPPR